MSRKIYGLCEVEGCGRQAVRRTYCDGHYRRWLKYGDPTAGYVQRCSSPEEAIRTYVKQVGDCFEWTGYRDKLGYGRITIYEGAKDKTTWLSHRYAWTLEQGPIPDGMIIDHICHNPSCIKIDHLRVATYKHNQENRQGAQVNSTTGVRGVYWLPDKNRWQAKVKNNGKYVYSKLFKSLEEAERAAIKARNRFFTHNDSDRKRMV